MTDNIRIAFTDYTGTRHADVTLNPALTAAEVIERLVTHGFLPPLESGQVYALQFNSTTIQPNQTLKSISIQDGDTIIAGIMTRGGGGVFFRTFRDIQLIESVLNNGKAIKASDKYVLFAVFLYTELDKSLASYIREHIRELHEMSNGCLFFVIEKPSPELQKDVKNYLGDLAGEYFDALWARLGTDNFQPYDKTIAYDIGNKLKIMSSQFPCVVFFTRLNSNQIAAIEINNFVDINADNIEDESTRFFRKLFSSASKVMQTSQENVRLKELLKLMYKGNTKQKNVQPDTIQLTSSVIEVIGTIIKTFF